MTVDAIYPRPTLYGAWRVNLISDALPFGRLWYGEPNAVSNAIDYAKFRSRSHGAVMRVYDSAANVIETQRAQDSGRL
jgi:hypothetical protein